MQFKTGPQDEPRHQLDKQEDVTEETNGDESFGVNGVNDAQEETVRLVLLCGSQA